MFVSGASKGVGRATSIAFAKAGVAGIAIGARSDLSSVERDLRDAAIAANRAVPKIKQISLDVLDKASIEDAAAETAKAFGRLDILINNAGAMEEFKRAIDSDPDSWWNTWTVNLRGTYLLTRALLPLMLEGGDKQIVILSSIGAFMQTPGASGYQMSKLALVRYSTYLNNEYGDQGLVSYALHPGAIPTELGLTLPKKLHAKMNDTPELAGDTIVFLASQKREWLKGRYVSCTWDMTELMKRQQEIVDGDKLTVKLVI